MVSITTKESPTSQPAEQVKAIIKDDPAFFEIDTLSNKSGNNEYEKSNERIDETTQKTSLIVQRFHRDAGDSL